MRCVSYIVSPANIITPTQLTISSIMPLFMKNTLTSDAMISPMTPMNSMLPNFDKSVFNTIPITPIAANIPAAMKNTEAMLPISNTMNIDANVTPLRSE